MNEMIQPVTHHLKIKCDNPKFISLGTFPNIMQLLQWHFGPDHVFINSLKVERLSQCLISLGRLFQILGPRLLSVYEPYFIDIWLWTINRLIAVSLLVFN